MGINSSLGSLGIYPGKQQSKLPPPRKWQNLIIGGGEGKHKLNGS